MMKFFHRQYIFLVAPFVILSLTSCKTECPGFPAAYNDYFPYHERQEVKFSNGVGDTLSLIISEIWATDSYSLGNFCKCVCESSAGFKTDFSSQYSLSISLNSSFVQQNFLIESIMDFDQYNESLSYSKEITTDPNKTLPLDNLTDTINLVSNFENNERVDWLKLVYNKGLVEFNDLNYRCVWKLVE